MDIKNSPRIGKNTRALLGGLWASGPFFIIARAATAGTQILAARLLGPREFGLTIIISAWAGVLIIPAQLGFPQAIVKFTAMEKNPNAQAQIISSAWWLSLSWALLVFAVLSFGQSFFSHSLRISSSLYFWILTYAFLVLIYTLLVNSLQGLFRFKERGLTEMFYGLLTLTFFCFFYFLGEKKFASFIGAMDAGLLAASIICFFFLRSKIKLTINRDYLKPILSYLTAPVLGAAAAAGVQYASPLILAAYLPPQDVGLYGIYLAGSVGAALAISYILSAILGPLASDPEKQSGAWRKFLFLSAPLSLAAFFVFAAGEFILLKLAGKRYPLNAPWVALFSAAAVFCVLSNIASTLIAFQNARGLWLGSLGSALSGILCLIANALLIPHWKVSGAVAALILSYTASFFWCVFWRQRDPIPI